MDEREGKLFPLFDVLDVPVGGGTVRVRQGGTGPPVLLLHGYPQTGAAWHRVAPALAKSHTVVVADLPGYGDSVAAPGTPQTKRGAAGVLADAMAALGHRLYAVVGHDRGARVGHRLALDRADTVVAFTSLAVVPITEVWPTVDAAFARRAFHWFLLAQPPDLPERLLAADPIGFLDWTLVRMAGNLDRFDTRALDAYRGAFARPSVRSAICEDYRAAFGADAELDAAEHAAGRRLECPVLVLWPEPWHGPPPLEAWRRWANRVEGHAVASGHLMPEEAPSAVLAALRSFLSTTPGHAAQHGTTP